MQKDDDEKTVAEVSIEKHMDGTFDIEYFITKDATDENVRKMAEYVEDFLSKEREKDRPV